jgi:hypothetical protein
MSAPLAALAVTGLLVSQAVGAPEGMAQEAPRAQSPAQTDDHSYLPPWMQPKANAAPTPGMQSQYLNALDDPALKQKALAQQQQQQKPVRRRHSSPFSDFFW